MKHLMACRVCLAYDIRLHSISGDQLQDIYEKSTETSLESGDTKPTCVCYICFSLLKKFQKFIEKSKKSDRLLNQMLDFGLELSVNTLELFRAQQTDLHWTLGKTPTVRVISVTEEEVNVETPIKTEYVNSEMDVRDQNEDGIPLEDTDQDSTTDSEDNLPLQSISKQWKADCLKKKIKVSLKRSNVSGIKTAKILKPAREIISSKQEQLQQTLERSKSLNYQNSPFKCDLCCKGFVDAKAFENHQEEHAEVSVNSLELFREQQTDLPWTLGRTAMVGVTSVTEEELSVESPIKTEYDNSDMDVGDQNEGFEVDPEKAHDDWHMLKTISEAWNSSDEVSEANFKESVGTPDLDVDLLDIVKEEPFADDGIPLEDTNQDSTSDSDDNMPIQNISKQWKAECLEKKSKASLKRSNVSEMKTPKIVKPDARETILSKEEQLQQTLERSKSLNYQNSPFKCDLCYKGFMDTKAFEIHQEKHDEVLHLCKSFKRKSDNETEKEMMKSQEPFKKTEKGEENKAQNEEIPDFEVHSGKIKTIKTIIPNDEPTTSYIKSDIKNSKIEAYSNERVTAPKNMFTCNVCKIEYLYKNLLENHIKKWHIIEIDSKPNLLTGSNENYQNCKNTNLLKGNDVLNYSNVTENKLSKNKNKHKDSTCSDETQYKCSYCSKSFNDGALFTRHVRIHTEEKPYKCSYCTKCFTQSGHLNRHVRSHTRESPYKCSYCTKCFFDKNHLATHVRTHTGEKPYKCRYCIKCFTQSSHLVKHVRLHTGEKPYKCSYCTKCFIQGGDLATHLRVHTGEKPYKCSYCTKSFAQSSSLTVHARIHTGEKPYK